MTKMTATPIYGKTFKNLLLQNQKACDIRTWYIALGMWGLPKIVSEYDQEIPQSQTADNSVAPRGRAAQPSRDTRKAN